MGEDMDMVASADQLNHTMVMEVMADTDMDMDVKNTLCTTQYAIALVPSLTTYPSNTLSLNPLILSSRNLKKEIFDLSSKRNQICKTYNCKLILKMLQLFGVSKFNMIVMNNFFFGK